MPRVTMPPDATVATALSTIAEPEDYLRVVIAHLNACDRIHGNAHVYIGVTGTGVEPSHMVAYRSPDTGEEAIFDRYGRNVPFGDLGINRENWSRVAMTYDEVKGVLHHLRSSHAAR